MFHYISLMRLCKWICRKYINDLQVWFGPITRYYCQKFCLYWLKLGSSMTSDEFCWKWEFGTIHKLCFREQSWLHIKQVSVYSLQSLKLVWAYTHLQELNSKGACFLNATLLKLCMYKIKTHLRYKLDMKD